MDFPTIFSITEEELDLDALLDAITLSSTGAAAIFTANNTAANSFANVDPQRYMWTSPAGGGHCTKVVPACTANNFTSNKQVLLSNTPDGIWVFHVVNRDTRGGFGAQQHR